MVAQHNNSVTFHGKPFTLIGRKLKEGDQARDIRLVQPDLSTQLPLKNSTGKARLFITVPSLDTNVCALETKTFDQKLATFGDSVVTYVISADLPFAQDRWRNAEGIENVVLLSDYHNLDFARNWGLLIRDLGLLARAVYIVDANNTVNYCQIVPELTEQPNYEAALSALQATCES
jgi:thiol peroxidase